MHKPGRPRGNGDPLNWLFVFVKWLSTVLWNKKCTDCSCSQSVFLRSVMWRVSLLLWINRAPARFYFKVPTYVLVLVWENPFLVLHCFFSWCHFVELNNEIIVSHVISVHFALEIIPCSFVLVQAEMLKVLGKGFCCQRIITPPQMQSTRCRWIPGTLRASVTCHSHAPRAVLEVLSKVLFFHINHLNKLLLWLESADGY